MGESMLRWEKEFSDDGNRGRWRASAGEKASIRIKVCGGFRGVGGLEQKQSWKSVAIIGKDALA